MDDKLLIRYIQRNCSKQDAQTVLRWIESSEENKERFRQLYVVWLAAESETVFFAEERKVVKKKHKTLLYYIGSAVASVAAVLLICLMGDEKKEISYDYESYLLKQADSNEILLAIGKKEPISIQDSMAVITYNVGKQTVQVNNDTLEIESHKGGKHPLNTIRVPYGKRSLLSLSDGTLVHLNSGASLVYPSAFDDSHREVYLEGEAYFEVSKAEKQQPFWVKTAYKTVKVTGTRFNVLSDRGLQKFETVLVSGKISVDSESGSMELIPNQCYKFSNVSKSERLKEVDVRNYISWIDGKLKFDKERLSYVLYKLEKVYNIKITLLNSEYADWRVSGMLDLQNTGEETVGMLMRILIPGGTDKKLFVIEFND